jgi:TRAP-type C4-dicarboxylate transport system substrate-binding protein
MFHSYSIFTPEKDFFIVRDTAIFILFPAPAYTIIKKGETRLHGEECMKNRKTRVLCFFLILAVFTGFFACRKRGGETEGGSYILRMSTQLAESSPMVAGFRTWSEAVKQRTNGRMEIEVYTSAVLGSDEDVIEMALQGENFAVLTDGGRMANYVKEIGIVGMAYIADNYEELTKITETATFKSLDAELVNEGIRILSYNWYDGPRNFYTNKVINTPADLNGVRIRTPGAAVWSRSVASLGATPVAMPWNDSYNALQNKAIDGVEVQSTSAFPSRMYEVTKFITKTEHFQLANFIMVGERWFSTLPAEYQRILMEECKKASVENARQILSVAADFERQMVDNGMQINLIDKAPFVEAADRAYEELGFKDTRDKFWAEIGKR